YVTGGQKLDSGFLASLVLPAGMRVILYEPDRNGGQAGNPAQVMPLIDQVKKLRSGVSMTVGSGADAETFHALPLNGYDNSLLGALLVGSSRRPVAELEASPRRIGFLVAAAGIVMGVALRRWATTPG